VIFREKNTPAGKTVDSFDNVKVIVGQDVVQDIDMSREAFINKMSPDQRKQLEEFKKQNAEVLKSNAVVKHLNADLHTVAQDFKDADAALQTAAQTLGATASKADIAAKEAAIKTDKYTDAETLMLKDTQAKPDASILWAQLGQAQLGLKQYDAAEASYKKVLELETASGKKPNLEAQGTAYAGLGEIYARTGKIPEATAAYDEAAKAYPPQAGLYLKNEAVIFYQEHNPDAQAVAADKAVKADPTLAIAYYLKGNGLVAKTTVDPKTQKLTAPPGCIEAYKKYLELDPNGAFAGEVRGILVGFGQKTK
jgi:tetratricopeptide (TPR) repeat protein